MSKINKVDIVGLISFGFELKSVCNCFLIKYPGSCMKFIGENTVTLVKEEGGVAFTIDLSKFGVELGKRIEGSYYRGFLV
ncbi:hypothetical protein K0B03_01785 [Patescibacteria group bacterium]|nr:hypothetical protein [Patescibacteria group bacterium]